MAPNFWNGGILDITVEFEWLVSSLPISYLNLGHLWSRGCQSEFITIHLCGIYQTKITAATSYHLELHLKELHHKDFADLWSKLF